MKRHILQKLIILSITDAAVNYPANIILQDTIEIGRQLANTGTENIEGHTKGIYLRKKPKTRTNEVLLHSE